ncbi:MAG: photosystem II biogenesis protein Psp29 [Cyanobacteria bacterium Co-bin13]|nr:photosystem II biogenesis protein Psp29 [Cyanobacteria bacterium Co-bin13]
MNNVRTVSDTKRDFYAHHTRPINSIYRRVVDELLVEMHLLHVNVDFVYDPIYALGVVTTFDRFMQGYQPEADRDSIFRGICQAIGSSPEQYRHDAGWVKDVVAGQSLDQFKALFEDLGSAAGQEGLRGVLAAIATRESFKYNRPFGIGLYTLVEAVDPEVLKDTEKRNELFVYMGEQLKISVDKLQKDLDLYRSNLEKFAQAQAVMQDILAADRKKREAREKAVQAAEAVVAPSAETSSPATDSSAE